MIRRPPNSPLFPYPTPFRSGGIVSYHRLPIEAYPDVGDVKVEVITLWPGHAAEEVERLITVPLENELNGIANVTFLRSEDRKSTRLNSSHLVISYAAFCLKK